MTSSSNSPWRWSSPGPFVGRRGLTISGLLRPHGLRSEVAQSCVTLCDPMDCSLPGSSVGGLFQARILEWVAIFFSRASSRPRDLTQVSRILGRCFTLWVTRKARGLRAFLNVPVLLGQLWLPRSLWFHKLAWPMGPSLCDQVVSQSEL